MSHGLEEKINNLIDTDDTEIFFSLISEIIEENKDYASDLEQILNEAFNVLSENIDESNLEKKMSFICLFFEILISENIDFSIYLQKIFEIITQNDLYSDDTIKRIINICSNADINKKELFNNLTLFSKNKIEYLYIIFSLAGFKEIIIDNLSENWELIVELLDNPEIKSNSNSIKNLLKCLEVLINLSEEKFRPYASSALYQALDYLTETDTELQKRSLMIIYSLTKYCDEQLQPLSENIIDFLKVLQNGNNIEINNLCNTMLKHFNEEKEEEENEKENEEENIQQNDNNEDSNGNNKEDENENNENIINDKNKDELENEQNKASEHEEENEYENNQNEEKDIDNKEDEKENALINNYVKEERQEKENQNDYNEQENEEKNDEEEYNKNEEENEEIDNNEEIENNEEKENYEDNNKYEYKKRNINQYEQNKNKNEIAQPEKHTNNDLNNIDINAIIRKIKDLSDKQIIILDSIEQYKRDTKRIINQKKLKIQSLEAKIEELQEKIRIEKNKRKNMPGKTNYQLRRKKNEPRKNNNKNDYNNEDGQYNNYDY